MRYQSTRGGGGEPLAFLDVVLEGLARDGGLFVPAEIPSVADRLEEWKDLSFPELALQIIRLYADDIPLPDLKKIVDTSYATFDCTDVCPVTHLQHVDVLELFHGPTLAFKDVALQFLANVFEYALRKSGRSLNILGATSGDTGSAAVHAIQGKERTRVFIMHPEGKTSEMQRLQMVTVLAPNVYNVSIDGSFDDCQHIMKEVFNELEFKDRYHLGTINSINFARILAQITYYFSAYLHLPDIGDEPGRPVSFCVPTGNFGDIFAGYLAKRMGLPVHKLIVATNENDILARFFQTGEYRKGPVEFTISPSMDIQVASNFERYLYYRFDGDTDKVRAALKQFQEEGTLTVPKGEDGQVDGDFLAGRAGTPEVLATIKRFNDTESYVLDPHTAVGVYVAEQLALPGRTVCLATAHAAKFPESIRDAIGTTVTHPTLEALKGKEQRYQKLPNDKAAVMAFLRESIEAPSIAAPADGSPATGTLAAPTDAASPKKLADVADAGPATGSDNCACVLS